MRDSSNYYGKFGTQTPTFRGTSNSELNKHRFFLDNIPPNKLETYADAPPSILGSFSNFGHATVKARGPAKTKKKYPHYSEQFEQAESRPGVAGLVPPPPLPIRGSHPFAQTSGYNFRNQPLPNFRENEGQAYYFDASLSTPVRDSALNLVPPPPSSSLTPNTYYFEMPQYTSHNHRGSFPTKDNSYRNSGSQYFQDNRNAENVDFFRSTVTPSSNIPLSIQNSQSALNRDVFNKPANGYYNGNPFGDITLNSRPPDNFKPSKQITTAGKDVFNQLSHLGRPFQSSSIDSHRFPTPGPEFSSQRPVDYFTTSVNDLRYTPAQRGESSSRPNPSPVYPDMYNTKDTYSDFRPDMYVTQQPFPQQEVYPITVTTVDITSPDNAEPTVNRDREPVSYHQESYEASYETTTQKPKKYHRPQVEINTYQGHRQDVSASFLPTPSTDTEPYLSEPTPHSEATTTSPEHFNEVTRPSYRPRHKPRPTTEPPQTEHNYADTFHSGEDLTTRVNYQDNTDVNTRVAERPQQHYHRNKNRRRRPSRPQKTQLYFSSENPKDETYFASSVGNVEEYDGTSTEAPVTTPVTQTNPYRRRKKPPTRQRVKPERVEQIQATVTSLPQAETTVNNEYTVFSTVKVSESPDNTVFENYPPKFGNNYEQVDDDKNTITTNIYVSTDTTNDVETPTEEITTTTTARTSTTRAPELPSTVTRLRSRNKYGNYTRPRFSVKDYRVRLNRTTSTTVSPKEVENENEDRRDSYRVRYSTRTRGSAQYKENEGDSETSPVKYRTRHGGTRYSYRSTSTTTQSPLLQVDSPATTERLNTFRPSSSRYRPGTGKYYSRYRTSTEAPSVAHDSSSTRAPVRPKGVFSAKRRPYPLRPRPDTSTRPQDESEESKEEESENIPTRNTHTEFTDNEVRVQPDKQITKKLDDTMTTTVMTSSEEERWSSAKPETILTEPSAAGDISRKVADLTSSPSNAFEPSGFLKGVSPSSRRTVSQITLATDDPILPIEAFFQSWSSPKSS